MKMSDFDPTRISLIKEMAGIIKDAKNVDEIKTKFKEKVLEIFGIDF